MRARGILLSCLASAVLAAWAVDRWHVAHARPLPPPVAPETLVRLESVYRADTVRLTRWRVRWDSVRDTLWRRDTLTVRESILVAVADSTIGACRDALSSCEVRTELLAAALARVTAERDSIVRARRPGWRERIGWGAVGFVAGSVTRR